MKQADDPKPAPVAVTTPPKQAGEANSTRTPWWWVERCVWTGRMLTRLTSGEPADQVWFALWDKTYAPANLQSACQKVWRNGGSAGADAQTVAHFGRHVEEELQRLREQLRDGTYRPQPVTQPGGFDFLGYHFERGMKWPRKKSLMKMRDRLRAKTSRLDGRSLPDIVQDVNRSLRGWYQYYQHSKATTFSAMDGYVRRRLRSMLQWRKDGVGKGIGAAHQRWPNEWFARCGRMSLKTEHEWTRAIVGLRTH